MKIRHGFPNVTCDFTYSAETTMAAKPSGTPMFRTCNHLDIKKSLKHCTFKIFFDNDTQFIAKKDHDVIILRKNFLQ
jgi:hypothetical protein